MLYYEDEYIWSATLRFIELISLIEKNGTKANKTTQYIIKIKKENNTKFRQFILVHKSLSQNFKRSNKNNLLSFEIRLALNPGTGLKL